jgi:leader peptidase (prepilin peptidase)/N-methyltransferase
VQQWQRERAIEITWAGEALMLPRGWAIALCAVLGAIVGSFLGAALVRLPRGESAVAGRSTCDACGRVLGALDLVPIVSFLALRGRCRTCGAAIDRWQFAAELGGMLVGVAAAAFARDGVMLGLGLVLGWQLLLLGLLDLRHFWLPDRLILLLAAIGAVPALLAAASDPMLLSGPVLGALLGFAMLWMAAHAFRAWRGIDGLGQGDSKLLGAIGLWLGPLGVVATLLGGALTGLAAAAGLALAGKAVTRHTALPLGSCLALAGFAVYLGQN